MGWNGLFARRSEASRSSPPMLALQGGGAHGAFTWGVLDALLEHDEAAPAAATGASAGAINAVLLAEGLVRAGLRPDRPRRLSAAARDEARAALAAFWLELAEASPFERHAGWLVEGPPDDPRLSPTAQWFMQWAGLLTPEQLDPLDLNPLRRLITKHIDFARLRVACPMPLFVAATRLADSALRVFREHELGVEVLLASACLPRWHRTVEIDGVAYWDGGFSANPPLAPLVFDLPSAVHRGPREVLLVLLAPPKREVIPTGAREIAARQAELSFAAPLVREWQWIERLRREVEQSSRPRWLRTDLERRLMSLRLHTLDAGDVPALHRTESKMIANRAFVESLRDAGRAAALRWIAGRRAQSSGASIDSGADGSVMASSPGNSGASSRS